MSIFCESCHSLAPCLSCMDRVLAEGVLYDGDEQVEALAIDAGLERALAEVAEESRMAAAEEE